MKKIIFVILALFIFTPQIFSQEFELPIEINQGFKFKDYKNPQLYLLNTSAKPTIVIDNFILSSIVTTSFSDGVTDVFAGTGVNYKVYKKDNWNLQLGGSALFGTNKRQLYGLNITGEFDDLFYLVANIRQEYSQKELWFDAGIGIKAIK